MADNQQWPLTPQQEAQMVGQPPTAADTAANAKVAGDTKAQQTKAQQQAAAKAQAQKVESIKQQINDLTAGATYAQTTGAAATALANKIAPLLAQLPAADATQILNSNPALKGTGLGTAVTNAAQTAGAPAAKPAAPQYDPLALQTMWQSVFGPAFQQASKIAGTAGTGYLAGMNQAIAGAHQSPQATQVEQGQSQAMANLLQQFGKTSAQNVPAGLTMDTLINALGQASGAAQLASGEAEKSIAYGQEAPLIPGSTAGTSATSPTAAAALLNGALGTPAQQIGANQTSGVPVSALYPNIP